MKMNRMLILVVVAMMTMMTVNAQSLTGRTYYNANILAGELNKKLKEVDQKIPEIKAKGYAEFEKKNGRKPTDAGIIPNRFLGIFLRPRQGTNLNQNRLFISKGRLFCSEFTRATVAPLRCVLPAHP
jgi:hypothetical protein